MKKTIFTDFEMFLKICRQLSKKNREKEIANLIKIEDNAMVYSDRFVLFKIYFQNLPYRPGIYWVEDLTISDKGYPDYTRAFPETCEKRFQFRSVDEYDYMELAKSDLPIPFEYWTIFQKHLASENWFAHSNGKNRPIVLTPESEYNKEKIFEQNFILVMPLFVANSSGE